LAETTQYQGLTSGRFVYWNLLPALVCTTLIFLLYKWLPSSGLAALIVLVNVPILFGIMTTPSFRFMYSLYLYGYFVVPLAVAELAVLRRRRAVAGEVACPAQTAVTA